MRKTITLQRILSVAFLFVVSGCADGPMFALKQMNPYYRRQWAKDSELGPTYHERLDEMRLLSKQIASMGPDEQRQWVEHIDAILEHDPSPEMRREAVLALTDVEPSLSLQLLQRASKDESTKVRMAVCAAIGKQDADQAIPILQPLLQDTDKEGVQISAIRALGNFQGPQTEGLLAAALQEKSPATQLAATEALAQSTGKSFGGNVPKWKSYLAGEAVEEEVPSIADKVMEWTKF